MKGTEDYLKQRRLFKTNTFRPKMKGAQASILDVIQEKRIGTNYDSFLSAWRVSEGKKWKWIDI